MDSDRIITTKTPAETQEKASELAGVILDRGPRILCLSGPLGAGKTTFVQGLAKGLGISRRILSPTFVLVRRYDIPETECRFYHVDLYRLAEAEIGKEAEITEILAEPEAVAAVEWGEKLGLKLPANRWDMLFRRTGAAHEITIRRITDGKRNR